MKPKKLFARLIGLVPLLAATVASCALPHESSETVANRSDFPRALTGATLSVSNSFNGEILVRGIVRAATLTQCTLTIEFMTRTALPATLDLGGVRFVFAGRDKSLRVIARSDDTFAFTDLSDRQTEVMRSLLDLSRDCGSRPSQEAPLISVS